MTLIKVFPCFLIEEIILQKHLAVSVALTTFEDTKEEQNTENSHSMQTQTTPSNNLQRDWLLKEK